MRPSGRAVVVPVAVLLVLAGCAGLAQDETTDCPQPVDYEPQPFPERPTTITTATASDFAATYENATLWNERVDRADTNLTVSTRVSAVNDTETGVLVSLESSASYRTCQRGSLAVADAWPETYYFVNDTLAVRLQNPDYQPAAPLPNGTVVENASS
jgi:hypothetical protein